MREAHLSEFPFCEHCAKKTPAVHRFATEVDHRDEDATNNDSSNLCSLCKPCHSRKTALTTIANRRQDGS